MKGLRLLPVVITGLLPQGCSFSNAPFFPVYSVEIDVTDPQAIGGTNLSGTFDKGTIEAITEVGACSVQLQLGQCKGGEQVWVLIKAAPNNTGGRGPDCTPSVWDRLKAAEGSSIAVGPSLDATRLNEGVVVEVLAGVMEDTDGNQVVDKHTDENRLATSSLTHGRIDVHRASDAADPLISGVDQPGEFLAEIDVHEPLIGFVRGRVDASVDATDGLPVGPRCSWEVLAEDD